MFSHISNPNSLLFRPPPPPPLHSSASASASLPSPTSPNLRSPLTATAYAAADSTFLSLPPSLYEILGISMGATGGEIKTAYRRLARTSHPDVKDSSADEFMKIHAAYSTLSDPEKRADYDRRSFPIHRSRTYSGVTTSAAASYNGFSGYSGRNWETDQCW